MIKEQPGNTKKGKYHCTVDLLFDLFGISCMTTDNFCFYLQNRLIQTSQTGGQQYIDTFPFSIHWNNLLHSGFARFLVSVGVTVKFVAAVLASFNFLATLVLVVLKSLLENVNLWLRCHDCQAIT